MFLEYVKPLLEWRSQRLSWHIPFLAALGVGSLVGLGVWCGQPRQGMLAATGAMVILYLPQSLPSVAGRMVRLIIGSSGFVVSYVLGAASAFHLASAAVMLGILTVLATTVCRWNRVAPPGSFFFVLTGAIACNAPFDPLAIPTNAGWVALGGATSCMVAFFYSVLTMSKEVIPSAPVAKDTRPAAILVESSVIGFFVALSLLAARLLKLENPYWVPVSCAAILQGGTFRAVWHRKVHRILGTAVGMGLSWFLFPPVPDPVALVGVVCVLVFVVEYLVPRHYGLAVIFITPLTVSFAEFSSGGVPIHGLFMTRLMDIALGSVIGAIGGWVLHHPQWCRGWEERVKRLPWTVLREG